MLYNKRNPVTLYGVRKIRFRTKKSSQTVLCLLGSILIEHASKMDSSKRKKLMQVTLFEGDR